MNDSMSILLATTVLALGGLGLYMYKLDKSSQSDDNDDDSYTEDGLFSGSDFFHWGQEENDKHNDKHDKYNDEIEDLDDDYDYEEEEEEYKPRKRSTAKTHKNKKSYGTSKRRY